jgi:hypothetical protein
MIVGIDASGLRRTKWYEYAIRFIFGGITTAAAGLIAHRYGPETGGLFLAFPAIFPASATLVEKHQREKKQQAGLAGVIRGREAAALDAAGSALGSIGLIAFAMVVSHELTSHPPVIVLGGATAVWLGVSSLCWRIRRALLRPPTAAH